MYKSAKPPEPMPEKIGDWAYAIARWRKEWGFETSWDNFAEKLMLTVAELGEAVDYPTIF